MHSGNHKYGRGGGGGGRGAGKKKVFTPPAPARISSSSFSGRLSLGGGSRNPPPSSAPTSSSETFSLVGGREQLSYAALIRLAPDLVEEIKRVEAQGGAAKIKFDPNPNNPLGNVIDVGGKEFRFTWSHETGGLCDIYEERQSGEDGNGLLVESGCAWRKLNVQRVLDESAKNRVKMLSEEAERNLKSRKAKLLDPSNGSMKSQMKALAASEVSPWKFKQNNFKKRNFEPSEVGRPPKSIDKSGFPSSGTTKGRHSFSPLPSPANQSSSLASPSMRGNVTETLSLAEDTTHNQSRTKENTVSAKKDSSPRSSDRMQEAAAHRDNQVDRAKDAQNLLITLLKDNPKGLSIKAVADRTSNPVRKIEPLLKKIATFDSSGVYILKPGIEVESQKLPPSDNGSSPEDGYQKQYFTEGNLGSTLASDFTLKPPPEDLEEQLPVSEPDLVKKIDASQHFTELFGDDDPPDNSEERAAISRESGSGSDSDSSDSGSDTRSRSRSRSPAGTASRSGSDSGNESSSHSKGSDVEIDILNEDDEEPKKLHDTHDGLFRAPIPWSMSEAGPLRVGDQEGYASEDIDIDIDIDNDFLGDNEAELASASHVPGQFTEKLKSVSPGHEQTRLYGVADKPNEPEEHSDSLTRSKGLSKRGSDVIQFEDNSEVNKRLKTGSMAQSSVSPRSSPDITNEDHHDNNNMQMSGTSNRNDFSGSQRGYNSAGPGKSASELLQSGQRPPLRSHDTETADKNVKNPRFRGLDAKKQEKNAYKLDGFRKHGDKGLGETRDGVFGLHEKVNGKFKGTMDKKEDVQPESNYEKHCEEGKNFHATGNSAKLQVGSSLKDGGQADLDKAFIDKRLQRELSDLELGELREPLEEPDVTKKQFERVGSFMPSDAKSNTFGSQNSDLKGRPSGKLTIGAGSPSLPNSRAGGPKSSGDWFKRTSPEPFSADTNRISHRPVQSQHQQSRVCCAEGVSLSNKAADLDRLEHNEGAANQGPDAEGYGESQKKSHVSAHVEEPKQDLGSRKTKGSKSLKHKSLTNGVDKRKDVSSIEGRNDKRKRSESSLDEDASYSKYEKEEPELKGLIETFSQYKEYVKEYSEKYEIYSSLNKILEDYRIEFQKLGMDLDRAKVRDMEKYHNISAQLRESYRRCGARHKRLKKIFIVLHKELKVLKQRIKDFALDYMKD